ncbi:hypothetical protein QJS66_07910 [Kocuria rhizophila]|nr:hypothetical protein QJS66_07910 [Kocuria rhizophila]
MAATALCSGAWAARRAAWEPGGDRRNVHGPRQPERVAHEPEVFDELRLSYDGDAKLRAKTVARPAEALRTAPGQQARTGGPNRAARRRPARRRARCGSPRCRSGPARPAAVRGSGPRTGWGRRSRRDPSPCATRRREPVWKPDGPQPAALDPGRWSGRATTGP